MKQFKVKKSGSAAKRDARHPGSGFDFFQKNWLAGSALVLLALAAYARAMNGAFVFDDYAVTELPATATLKTAMTEGAPYRWLSRVSFALTRHFFGVEKWAWHLPSVLFHAAAAVVVWRWIGRIGVFGRRAAWLGAALFALHPIQTQAVCYTYQRSTVLAGFFVVTALYFHARWHRTGRVVYGWMMAAACGLAFLSKENTMVLPLLLWVQERCLSWIGKSAAPASGGCFRSAPGDLARLWIIRILIIAMIAAVADAARRAGGLLQLYPTPTDYSAVRWVDYAVTELRVWGLYFVRWCWPFYQNADPDVRVVQGAGSGWAAWVLMGVVAALVLAALLAVVRKRGWQSNRPGDLDQTRMIGWGVLFFLTPLLPDLATVRDPMFEHRMYLCVPGLVLLSLTTAAIVTSRFKFGGKGWLWAAAGIAVLGMLTFARTGVWQSDLAFWTDVAAKSPLKARAHLNRGGAYDRLGDLEAAKKCFKEAYRVGPDTSRLKALSNIGMIEIRQGNSLKGLRMCRVVMKASPAYGRHYFLMGTAFEKLKLHRSALYCYLLAARKGPSDQEFQWQALNNRANLLIRLRRYKEARTNLNRAFALNNASPELFYNLGVLEELEQHPVAARAAYQRAAHLGHLPAIHRLQKKAPSTSD